MEQHIVGEGEKAEERRIKLRARRRRERNWFDTVDLAAAAQIMEMNLAVVETYPVSRRSGVEMAEYGGAAKPWAIIFGGTQLDGGHWVLAVDKEALDEDFMCVAGSRTLGSLEEFWTRQNFAWSDLPEEVKGTMVVDAMDLTE